MTIGFRIRRNWERLEAATVAQARTLPVANISDCMARLTAGGAGLRPMHRGGAMAGPALTVRSRPGDNLMLHKAIDMAAPGDVIICDAGGDCTNALMGELMLAHAIRRGVGGFVIHGAIRDAEAIGAGALPVFALGVTHRGPYKDGPGEIGFPIAIAGMVVEPGDLVVGDADGVLAIPRRDVAGILAAATKKHAAETRQMAETEAGTVDRAWVDATLAKLGCTFID